jgi:hypothetical protein
VCAGSPAPGVPLFEEVGGAAAARSGLLSPAAAAAVGQVPLHLHGPTSVLRLAWGLLLAGGSPAAGAVAGPPVEEARKLLSEAPANRTLTHLKQVGACGLCGTPFLPHHRQTRLRAHTWQTAHSCPVEAPCPLISLLRVRILGTCSTQYKNVHNALCVHCARSCWAARCWLQTTRAIRPLWRRVCTACLGKPYRQTHEWMGKLKRLEFVKDDVLDRVDRTGWTDGLCRTWVISFSTIAAPSNSLVCVTGGKGSVTQFSSHCHVWFALFSFAQPAAPCSGL